MPLTDPEFWKPAAGNWISHVPVTVFPDWESVARIPPFPAAESCAEPIHVPVKVKVGGLVGLPTRSLSPPQPANTSANATP